MIKRTIFKADNKSKWRINGKLTDRGSVLEKLKKVRRVLKNLYAYPSLTRLLIALLPKSM